MQIIRANLLVVVFAFATCIEVSQDANAQPPDRLGRVPGGPNGGRRASSAATTLESFVAKWLTMDSNADGQLTEAELKDERLSHLFKTSDKNSDGILTKDEMKLLFESSIAINRPGRGGSERPGRPNDGRPGDGRPGDGRPGDGRPGDGRPGDGRPGDQRSDPDNKGQVRREN